MNHLVFACWTVSWTSLSSYCWHDVTIIDPLEVFGEGGALSSISAGELRLPTYFAKPDSLPKEATNLMDTIRNADCILVISPEYNHTVPPALSSLMGHFGGSLYKCKPSGIITYSSGPFAGQRAMIGIQAKRKIRTGIPIPIVLRRFHSHHTR